MTYQDFKNEWLARRIDFDHSGIYLAEDLVREYIFSMYKLGIELPASPTRLADIWRTQPEGMSDFYYQSNDPTVKQGDIVFLRDFEHVVIANGEQTPERFECLEQNAVGSKTGIGDDAVRENWYDKADIKGIYRPRFEPSKVEPTVEEISAAVEEIEPVSSKTVARPYKPPTGALKVPLNVQRVLVKAELFTYPTPGLAVKREKPTDRIIRVGMQEFDELKFGMLKVAGETLWINPTDNVLKPKYQRPPQVDYQIELQAAKEAEQNYRDFTVHDDPNGQAEERYYAAKATGAFVIDFADGRTRTMPPGAHVWLAGYTKVGEMGYGIATNCLEDAQGNRLNKPRWIGIALGQLYLDDTFNTQTTVEERKLFHTLKARDYVDQARAKVQKKFLDIKKG